MPDEARKFLKMIDNSLDYPAPMVYGPEFDRAVEHLRRILAVNEKLQTYKQEVEDVAEVMYQHTMKRLREKAISSQEALEMSDDEWTEFIEEKD